MFDVRVYPYVFVYTCHVFLLLLLLCVLLYCCCCSCSAAACRCCSSSCAGWQNLLLWSTASDFSAFFLFIQTRCIFYVTLGSTRLQPRFTSHISYILGNYGHAHARMYLYIPAMYICCCCSVCCYTAVAAAAVLLLAAAVRPRVPDDKICCCGTLHLIPVFSFLFIQTRCIFNVTLGSTL